MNSSIWEELPTPLSNRYHHNCGVVINGASGKEVVIAGGWENFLPDTVEIFNLQSMTWRTSGTERVLACKTFLASVRHLITADRLPNYGVFGATKVAVNESFVLVGGGVNPFEFTPTILKYEVGSETWTELPGELSEGRQYVSAVLVYPQQFPNC